MLSCLVVKLTSVSLLHPSRKQQTQSRMPKTIVQEVCVITFINEHHLTFLCSTSRKLPFEDKSTAPKVCLAYISANNVTDSK